MNGVDWGLLTGCGLTLCIAMAWDTLRRKIPNRLTFTSALLGAACSVLALGITPGVLHSMQGWALGLGILLIPFLLGGMGGGDVKLLAAAGAWIGPGAVFNFFLYAALIGAVMGLVKVFCKNGKTGLAHLGVDIITSLYLRQPPMADKEQGLPYSIPIGMGFGAWLLLGNLI